MSSEHLSDLETTKAVKYVKSPSEDYKKHLRMQPNITLGIVNRQKTIEEQRKLINRYEVDSVTGVLSRQLFDEDLPSFLKRAKKGGSRIALAFIDADKFKKVNDEHGHTTGDRLLKVIAGGLVSVTRPEDRTYRFGGDELVVLMIAGIAGEIDDEALTDNIYSRLKEGANESLREAGFDVSVSVGVAISNPNDDQLELLNRADQAMYADKNARENI